MFSLHHGLALRQLRQLEPQVRLVVIHPNYIQNRLLLNEFLHIPDTVYVRFTGQKLTSDELNDQLQNELQVQTQQSSLKGVRTLVLDECDRSKADEFDAFLPQMVESVGDGRVIIFSRRPLRSIAHYPDLRRQACFLPVAEDLMLWDYAHYDDQEKALLEVRSLGSGWVHLNGIPVTDWDGLLPRSLFFFLVDKGMTTRNDIFQTFWPNLTVREATNVFHVTKRKISEVLGIDLTSYWSGFYHISPKIELSYDVVQFSEMVQNSIIQPPEESSRLLRHAISLYRNDFLVGMSPEWVKPRREELQRQYGDALNNLARNVEQEGDTEQALGLYLRAIKSTRHREDIAYNAMMIYRKTGRLQDALLVYERLREEVERELNVAPARYIQELVSAIQAELPS